MRTSPYSGGNLGGAPPARGSRIFRLVIPARIYFTRGEENLWWHAMQISLPLVQNLFQAHDWFVT